MNPVYHLALTRHWQAAGESYTHSTRGRTLAEEGFIHCSKDLDQLHTVAAAFYADLDPADLLILHIDPTGLDLRLEGGFPHLYGPLPRAAVTATTAFEPLTYGTAKPGERHPR